MKYIQIILICFFFSGFSFAQETNYSFSLQEAIDFALEHNREAKNAIRDVKIAEKEKWEATATGLPQINGNVDYQNWIKQQVSLIPGEIAGGEPGTFVPIVFGTQQTMNVGATVNQLLFDGSYLVGLQAAKVYLIISENSKTKTDLDVRNAIINAYGNVLLANESLKIVNNNIAILEKNLDETTKIYENGLEEEESVEQLQITLTSLKSYQTNNVRLKDLAYKMFNITLGLDVDSDTSLTDNLETLTIRNISLDLLNSDENVENTIDYRIASNFMETRELLLKLEQNAFLPSMSAFLSAGYNGFSEDFTFATNNQQWFGQAYFGINMGIPIFSSGLRRASVQRARIEVDKAKEELTEVEQRLKFQIANAKSAYQFAVDDYSNKKENLNLAERIESKNETKFFEGIATSFDLRQAQTQLYSAQQEYLQSMFNVISKKAELETLLNTVNY